MVATTALSLGCAATQASLTVLSQPEGAYITEIRTGKSFGMAPIAVVYNPAELEQNKNSEGCYMVGGFEARWVSGAISIVDPIKLCGSNVGSYNIGFNRNPSHPGLEKDLQFVIQLQTLRAQQQQASAQQQQADAAAAALWSALSDNSQNSSNNQQTNINCTTRQSGNTIRTNCR